ncbi:MAG: ABC transporter ATP-binding protein [candidate division Zixibacteria bacterium]|nr:ABC transporter ATP-binding protein [candidate division Zixibacteria bacterium]NIR68126.1 ABC transporter ATP-binding protein [candidate division Zixibacteria bacterium]NIS17790.1 ABC transporter ATP-binding protein [candidate division Zixibacteria bacterium]NIS49341.1 ABC transporter ATP-binding protein [candidate division Zixibacteria bacterium]NIT54118.1 ABC transporter ATP-binding protein [candidate division Zixibacteria bacterium]
MRDKIKWLWKYYKRYPYLLIVLIVLTPVQAAFQVAIPRMVEFTVDFVKTGTVQGGIQTWLAGLGADLGLSTAATYALTLVALGIIACALYAFVQSHRAWMNFRLEWMIRQDSFNDITRKGPDFFNKFRTGDLVTRLSDDIEQKLAWFACSGIFRFYEAVVFVIFTLAMMITIDPMLTLMAAGPVPILILIFFKSASILDRRYDNLQRNISGFNDIMEACFSGIRVVKAYVKEKVQKKKFHDAAVNRRAAEISAIKATTIVDSLYMYIWQFGVVIVLLAGGYMVIRANLSIGELVAFVYYVVYLIFPMFDIGQFLVKSRQSAVSINRLWELQAEPAMVTENGSIGADGDFKGGIEYKNVSFRFPDSDRNIIDDISIKISPGETIALVGKVGSGKSWMVNMVPRLVDPTEGEIRIDDHRLDDYKLSQLRRQIGYVPQEPVLFSDTVKNNILFGREYISEEVMNWAIDVSQLKSEIGEFPDGINTYIGTRGVSISGGQKQRLALARALAGKPKILILDDCTSALDSSTESALWARLHEVMPDMTTILITHRPDTLESADVIYVLEDGRIVETGKHAELIQNGGQYAKMYRRYRLAEEVVYG